MKVNWYTPDKYIDNTGGKPILDIVEDDSYSLWVYKYKNNNFTMIGKKSNCK